MVQMTSFFPAEPLRIVAVLRKLPGSTQSNLVQCDDGRLYVAKLYPNPQSPNCLANEAIGNTLLSRLGIPSPSWRRISLSRTDIRRFPALCFSFPDGRHEPEPGLHFASQYLADPDHTISERLASSNDKVANRTKLLDMYVFDIWANHLDSRQRIYKMNRQTGEAKMFFIDNSHLFGNRWWGESRGGEDCTSSRWTEPPVYVYDQRLSRCVQEQRHSIRGILHEVLTNIPSEWHGSDMNDLEAWLLQRLDKLRGLVVTDLEVHGFRRSRSLVS